MTLCQQTMLLISPLATISRCAHSRTDRGRSCLRQVGKIFEEKHTVTVHSSVGCC